MISLLYVDDEKLNLFLLKQSLSGQFNVVTAESGPEGLRKLKEQPDIKAVITDMRMPQMSGIEFIKQAKNNFSDKVYFILSGFDFNEEIDLALKNNLIANYFKKPFQIPEIVNVVNNALNSTN